MTTLLDYLHALENKQPVPGSIEYEARQRGDSFYCEAMEAMDESTNLVRLRYLHADATIIPTEGDGPGTLALKCVPYEEYGQFPIGEVKLEAGYFTASLEEIELGMSKAFIYSDSHEGKPTGLLASTAAVGSRGTAEFYELDDGLYAKVVLPDTQAGRDVAELVSMGVLDECSIGWWFDELNPMEGQDRRYTSPEGTLREVSMVNRGAFRSQKVSLASEEQEETPETPEVPEKTEEKTVELTDSISAVLTMANELAEAKAKIKELEADSDEEEVEISAGQETRYGHLKLVAGRKPKEGHNDRHRHPAARRRSRS